MEIRTMQNVKNMKTFYHDGICPVRDILSHIGSKWSVLILISLNANGKMRFSDIQRSLDDISQRMLTVTLRILEKDDLINRQVFPEIPPRVEYELLQKGKSFIPLLTELVNWITTNYHLDSSRGE